MKKDNRFIKVYSENAFTTSKMIIVDSETGVNYLYVSHGYGAGLTPLLDENGKPIITKEYKLN